jgi:predicted Zn finger-like uncharacterized protein
MNISCPNCDTVFRIDDARIGPRGRKVRCSKCGYVWRVSPDGTSAAEEAAMTKPVPAPADETLKLVDQPETGQLAESPEPGPEKIEPTERSDEPPAPQEREPEQAGADGLTGEQRAKLAEARRKKPRRWFWIKVLLIFVIVAALLLLARNMLPRQDLGMLTPAPAPLTAPADVGAVDAKPVPTDPAPN